MNIGGQCPPYEFLNGTKAISLVGWAMPTEKPVPTREHWWAVPTLQIFERNKSRINSWDSIRIIFIIHELSSFFLAISISISVSIVAVFLHGLFITVEDDSEQFFLSNSFNCGFD